MSLRDRLFSFEGRVRRRDWWLWTVFMMLVSWSASQIVAPLAFGADGRVQVDPADPFSIVYPMPLLALMLGVGLLLFVPNVAMAVKRRHDRDKSGRFIIAVLVLCAALSWGGIIGMSLGFGGPLFWIAIAVNAPIGIYLYVVLGFLDGTPGPNRYGPSPKGLGGTTADTFS
jgi:uncharacterized membrane protein YhaH (DUF805 family)